MKIATYIRTHYSIGRSIIQPEKLAKRLKELGYDGAIIADLETLGGTIETYKALKEAGLKCILGMEKDGAVYLAKNKEGWKDLIWFRNTGELKIGGLQVIDTQLLGRPICYLNQEDAIDHKVGLCIAHECTFESLEKIEGPDRKFLESDNFYLKAAIEDNDWSEYEDYSPCELPSLPKYDENVDSNNMLLQLCRTGWLEKMAKKKLDKETEKIYVARVKYELDTLKEAGLADYFLIVADVYKYIRSRGWLQGPGRGSVGGCLTAYLLGITQIDSIKYNLIFERFWNPARKDKLPDIDCDVPTDHREEIIEYIRKKYGEDKVCQMCTYTAMKGRGAIQDVLRVRGGVDPAERNRITKAIPDEAKIADKLQEMKDNGEEPSIIMWALRNRAAQLKEWCYLDENEELQGPLSKRFEQAIRMEGIIKSRGRHAAGLTIAARPLKEICPMILDEKSRQFVTEVDMYAVEDLGILKLDILGLSMLNKVMTATKLINERHANNKSHVCIG